MRRALLVACLALTTLPGCFISRTKEKEVSSPRSARTCGNVVCDADEDCVRTSSGTFHCE